MVDAIAGAAGVLLVIVGAGGVIRGGQGLAAHGSNHPMRYPIHLPWLASRPTTAKAVFRIGQLYAAAGILMTFGAVAINEQRARPEPPPHCRTVSHRVQEALSDATHRVLLVRDTGHVDGSTICSIGHGNDDPIATIQTSPRRDAIGESFNASVHRLERNGLATRPFTSDGRRGVVGTAGPGSMNDHQVVIEDGMVIHTIAVHPTVDARANLLRIVASFEE